MSHYLKLQDDLAVRNEFLLPILEKATYLHAYFSGTPCALLEFIKRRRILNESRILAARNVFIGARWNGVVLPVHDRVRKDLRRKR
jgi:hypothetical protein